MYPSVGPMDTPESVVKIIAEIEHERIFHFYVQALLNGYYSNHQYAHLTPEEKLTSAIKQATASMEAAASFYVKKYID